MVALVFLKRITHVLSVLSGSDAYRRSRARARNSCISCTVLKIGFIIPRSDTV